jgi:hypothetical protein
MVNLQKVNLQKVNLQKVNLPKSQLAKKLTGLKHQPKHFCHFMFGWTFWQVDFLAS